MVRRALGFATLLTMRDKPERMSITLALEAFGADLRKAFDVVAHRDEGADAAEESCD